jgi:hypothetical protein
MKITTLLSFVLLLSLSFTANTVETRTLKKVMEEIVV